MFFRFVDKNILQFSQVEVDFGTDTDEDIKEMHNDFLNNLVENFWIIIKQKETQNQHEDNLIQLV